MIETQANKHQRRVFKTLLIITALGGLMFFLINVSRNQLVLASVELLAGVMSMFLYLKTYRTLSLTQFRQLTAVYVLIFYGIMFFAMTRDGVSDNIYIWVLVIPLLSYLLLGLKLGFMMTAGFVVGFILFFSSIYQLPEHLHSLVAVFNMVFCFFLVWGLSHAYEKATESSHKKLKQLATTDHLTGLLNRSLLKASFEAAQTASEENKKQLAVVVLDLDRFKDINDNHGHDVGDWVLQGFTQILKQFLDDSVYGFRMGGEEFCLICANMTLNEAAAMAEAIRSKLAAHKMDLNGVFVRVTVSGGVASGESETQSFKQLHAVADKRLYQAKKLGRNQVVFQG